MKNKTRYEVWFNPKEIPKKIGTDKTLPRTFWDSADLKQAKKIAISEFLKGSINIIIDSWKLDEEGDIDDNSRKHYSLQSDGKTFKQF